MNDVNGKHSFIESISGFCLENKPVVFFGLLLVLCGGILVAPFDIAGDSLPRDPVSVDAIPDTGANQQIVFTSWPGRSPRDVEDQITYPLTVAMLGLPGIKTVRSNSLLGFSSIYVIFDDDIDFYWSRSRILEKLNSLSANTLPADVEPTLGPDATALGQIFWYTLEGRDEEGKPAPGFEPEELRSVQDWHVRYALMSAEGVSEVASIGGFVREYHVDVDPDAMRAYGVTLSEIFNAVRQSNIDVGASTIEVNRVEYIVRGLGFLKNVEDLENTVIRSRDGIPIFVRNVAEVSIGPAIRRGALNKDGAEAVGGVVVARFGANPLSVIQNVKDKIEEIAAGLPVRKLPDGRTSRITVIPFYDRAGLIHETLETLSHTILLQILVTMAVVLTMVSHLRSSALISMMLPVAVLLCFVGMKILGIEANIIALSGIAIAVGTIVDMGIILCENILRHLAEEEKSGRKPSYRESIAIIRRATGEVGGAVITAAATTIISFLPVFAMTGAEGKMFHPLAWTKTLTLLAAMITALTLIPPLAHLLFCGRINHRGIRTILLVTLLVGGITAGILLHHVVGAAIVAIALYGLISPRISGRVRKPLVWTSNFVIAIGVTILLSKLWEPLGPERGAWANFVAVAIMVFGVILVFRLFRWIYEPLLRLCLRNKLTFMVLPLLLVCFGAVAWLGLDTITEPLPEGVREAELYARSAEAFPGLGREFMPPLDEGSFLWMPSTMPHASLGEALDIVARQDEAFASIPEVEVAVGKIGRAESALDPAPISMVETIINYKPEYGLDENGKRVRQWRDHIRSSRDIWDEVVDAGAIPGSTSAPFLQPIETRRIMLQSGMRAAMGVKVLGPDLASLEEACLNIERLLKDVPSIEPQTVLADRIVGKPYLEIEIDREAIARYGIPIQKIQKVIEVAIGGQTATMTVEGRERYPVRVRYQRERRDTPEALLHILVAAMDGAQIPLGQLANIRYVRGPQVIKSEDGFPVCFVTFDKKPGFSEVDVVEEAQEHLAATLTRGDWALPRGASYFFAGSYENQVHARKTLSILLPVALIVILIILYLQFRSLVSASLVFSGIVVAWSGGFTLLWMYSHLGFLDFSILGEDLQELFQVHPINLSVAVWVGFLALFGIASDDGVVMTTHLQQAFRKNRPTTREEIRETVLAAGQRRIRPCLMTTATTILSLLPILTSTGRGSDVMIPMAIPIVGGMTVELITLFVVPVLYCGYYEARLATRSAEMSPAADDPKRSSSRDG